jgi:pyridoxamine 5'-phosphate oxidase
MNPITTFKQWYQAEADSSDAALPSACCLSTIGLDDYPNARFVSLKEIVADNFIFTGSLDSRKGLELTEKPKASLTFWWPQTEKQVRVQGQAQQISLASANKYFEERSKASRLVSQICSQGASLQSYEQLEAQFLKAYDEAVINDLKRPHRWSGFQIMPKRIELMVFKRSRLHHRVLFTKESEVWGRELLQP